MTILINSELASNKKLAASTNKKRGALEGKDEGTIDGIKAMRVDDTPLPKSKNLDVLSEFEKAKKKKNASFVVVGMWSQGL